MLCSFSALSLCVFNFVLKFIASAYMHSHIGYICLTSPLCVFKGVLKLYNHTGYICLTFLHCVFKNVSSNCLPDWIQNHTGCIVLVFLHCVFLNKSSNGLPDRMHLCIIFGRPLVVFVWPFSTVRFQITPQIAQITSFFIILWLNILAVSPVIHPGPISSTDNS